MGDRLTILVVQTILLGSVAVGAGILHAANDPDFDRIRNLTGEWIGADLAAWKQANAADPNQRRPPDAPDDDETRTNPGDDPDGPNGGNPKIWTIWDIDPTDRVTVDQAKTCWDEGIVYFVDARLTASYQQSHVPDALSIPLDIAQSGDTPLQIQNEFLPYGDTTPIIVYCDGGTCDESNLVAQRLREAWGFRCHVMDGGLEKWIEAGYPEEDGPDPTLTDPGGTG